MMSPYGWATGNISIAKATTAVMFNQSTDAVAQWGAGIPGFASSMAAMSQGKFIMAAGGWPIRLGGATVGGIGVSGGNAPGRDDEVARAGLAAIEAMAPAIPAAPPMSSAVPAQAYMQSPPSVPYPSLQPAPSYPSMPQSPVSGFEGSMGNSSIVPRDMPPSTHHLAPDQESPYSEETPPFDQFSENRQGG